MMPLIIVVLINYAYASLTLTACTDASFSNKTLCMMSGYCEVNSGGTCQTMTECYRASEVAACIQATITGCVRITMDFQYDNMCGATGETVTPNGLLRFQRQANITRSPDITLSETPVSLLLTTTTPQKYTYQLFTLDILYATSTQLTDIINAFLQGQNQLITNTIQPKFLEKAVREVFQNIRDDITYTVTTRKNQLILAWSLVDVLFQRYWTYQSYYTVNYKFINFGFSDLNRELITMTGSNPVSATTYQIDITWSTYAYNGYIYVAAFAPEQFGITCTGQLSDLIYIKLVKKDGTVLTTTHVPLSIKYTWTNSATQTVISYSTFDPTFPAAYTAPTATAVSGCAFSTSSTTYCPTFTLPAAALNQFIIFHHTAALSGCAAANPLKRLGMC